jgi:hypothetical protein
LDAAVERPGELDWAYRMATMAVSSGTEFVGYMLFCVLIPAALWKVQHLNVAAWVTLSVGLVMSLPAVLGFAFRGSPALRFMQVEVRRRDGRPASRLRCAWRSFVAYAGCLCFYGLFGAFYVAMFAKAMSGDGSLEGGFTIGSEASSLSALALSALCSAELLLLAFLTGAVYALARPQRGLQDLLAGTRLVPR